jgi:peroxiredoxin
MRKIRILLLIICVTAYANAQTPLQDCVTSSFYRPDSTINHADRLMLWIDCMQDKELPEFTAQKLNGDKLKSRDLSGKIVVLNLWFIDCLPCIKELPALNRLVKEYRKYKDVIFLSITHESKERIQNDFFKKYKLDFEIVPEANNVVEMFGKPGFPATFVFNREGKIKNSWLGGPVDDSAETEAYNRIKPVLDNLLKSE